MVVWTPDITRLRRGWKTDSSNYPTVLPRYHIGFQYGLRHLFHRGSASVKTAIAAASGSVTMNNGSRSLSPCALKPERRAAEFMGTAFTLLDHMAGTVNENFTGTIVNLGLQQSPVSMDAAKSEALYCSMFDWMRVSMLSLLCLGRVYN